MIKCNASKRDHFQRIKNSTTSNDKSFVQKILSRTLKNLKFKLKIPILGSKEAPKNLFTSKWSAEVTRATHLNLSNGI